MSTQSDYRNKIVYLAVCLIVFFAGFFKIADLDFWWHLKTGKIILEQRAFQYSEIYSFTAAGREYIDHEWLFQVIQYLLYSPFGAAGVILFKCAVLILIYYCVTRFLLRYPVQPEVAAAVLVLSIAGARTRFIERPELLSILFLVLVYVAIHHYVRTGNRLILLPILPLIIVWSNTHAAVILGLLVQLSFIGGLIAESFLKRFQYTVYYPDGKDRILTLSALFVISLLLTGVNPYGYRVLMVPFELTAIIDSGLLNNQEWRQPPLRNLPFYYLCVAFTFVLVLINIRRVHIVNLCLAAFFGYISLKYVRNVGIFCILMPLLVAPYVAFRQMKNPSKAAWSAAAFLVAILMFLTHPFEFGIGEASYFPDRIVHFTREKDLKGHLLNSYGFGGYLIWHLYPERRIFIDGRNEVFLPFLEKLIAVREGSRGWNRLLEEYGIEYALLNYVDDLEEVTVLKADGSRTVTYAPFTSTHFPRKYWAMIYWDDDGMIWIRRAGANQSLLDLEYTSVYPEGNSYQAMLLRGGRIDVNKAREELERKLEEDPSCRRARMLLTELLEAK